MGEPSLVVAFGALEAIDAGMSAAHRDLTQRIETMRSDVEGLLSGWQIGTDSRDAQIRFDRELGTWATELSAALDKVRLALVQVAADAHHAEVRNVAILD